MPSPLARRAELAALVTLAFFLPLYETPKTLAWLAYVLLWLANRARAADFGGRWDRWDTLIAAWIASGFVVAALAGVHADEWRGALDLLRYASVLWLAKRSRFSERELAWIVGALVVSAIVGIAWGYARLATGEAQTLQLNSVGHVNHSAIYLAIMLGVCASWFLTGERFILAGIVALVVLAALFVGESRAAVGIGIATLVVLAAFAWPRARRRAAAVFAVIVVWLAVAWTMDVPVIAKQEALAHEGNTLNFRASVWQLSVATWRQHPWFGIGMDNFTVLAHEQGPPYDVFPHAHSLYLNTLVERGVIGASALAAVLLAWAVALLRRRPAGRDSSADWLLWGSAASAWLVTVGVGMVNTTLHHEHGLLASLLLGLWLGHRDRR